MKDSTSVVMHLRSRNRRSVTLTATLALGVLKLTREPQQHFLKVVLQKSMQNENYISLICYLSLSFSQMKSAIIVLFTFEYINCEIMAKTLEK